MNRHNLSSLGPHSAAWSLFAWRHQLPQNWRCRFNDNWEFTLSMVLFVVGKMCHFHGGRKNSDRSWVIDSYRSVSFCLVMEWLSIKFETPHRLNWSDVVVAESVTGSETMTLDDKFWPCLMMVKVVIATLEVIDSWFKRCWRPVSCTANEIVNYRRWKQHKHLFIHLPPLLKRLIKSVWHLTMSPQLTDPTMGTDVVT